MSIIGRWFKTVKKEFLDGSPLEKGYGGPLLYDDYDDATDSETLKYNKKRNRTGKNGSATELQDTQKKLIDSTVEALQDMQKDFLEQTKLALDDYEKQYKSLFEKNDNMLQRYSQLIEQYQRALPEAKDVAPGMPSVNNGPMYGGALSTYDDKYTTNADSHDFSLPESYLKDDSWMNDDLLPPLTSSSSSLPPLPPLTSSSLPPLPPLTSSSLPPLPPLTSSSLPPLPPLTSSSLPPLPPLTSSSLPPLPPLTSSSLPPLPPLTSSSSSLPPLPPLTSSSSLPPLPPLTSSSSLPPLPPLTSSSLPPLPPLTSSSLPPLPPLTSSSLPPLPPLASSSLPPLPPLTSSSLPPLPSTSIPYPTDNFDNVGLHDPISGGRNSSEAMNSLTKSNIMPPLSKMSQAASLPESSGSFPLDKAPDLMERLAFGNEKISLSDTSVAKNVDFRDTFDGLGLGALKDLDLPDLDNDLFEELSKSIEDMKRSQEQIRLRSDAIDIPPMQTPPVEPSIKPKKPSDIPSFAAKTDNGSRKALLAAKKPLQKAANKEKLTKLIAKVDQKRKYLEKRIASVQNPSSYEQMFDTILDQINGPEFEYIRLKLKSNSISVTGIDVAYCNTISKQFDVLNRYISDSQE